MKPWRDRFLHEEDGAVTTDFVVLTAGIIGVAVTIMGSVQDATGVLTGKIAGFMDQIEVSPEDEADQQ